MKPLLKVMGILTLIFASTFILGRVLGILTVENVRWLLEEAQKIDPIYVVAAVVLLLFIDLVVAVPTLTITLLAGYFLGFPLGMAAALTGTTLAVLAGYVISQQYGDRALKYLVKEEQERRNMVTAFIRSGPAMIMLARAAPMIPEVTACMAGVTRMPLLRYLTFYALGTVPYVGIAAYAGSISSLNDPKPTIFAALGLYTVLWIGWFVYQRRQAVRATD